jgi:peptide/nickel transport system substrate-binding protein
MGAVDGSLNSVITRAVWNCWTIGWKRNLAPTIDGEPLAVKFMQLTGIAVFENEALQVQNQLKEIGIRIDIVDIPVDQFSPTLSKGEFELIVFAWVGTPYPFLFVSQIYGSTSASNYANLRMPEVDSLRPLYCSG